jgi:hypothetical protein
MILPILALVAGLVFSAHFSTVRTILGLFDRPGYHPPEGWSAMIRRTRARQEDPSFPVMVSLGRSLGTLLFVLGGWNAPVLAGADVPGWPAIPAGTDRSSCSSTCWAISSRAWSRGCAPNGFSRCRSGCRRS